MVGALSSVVVVLAMSCTSLAKLSEEYCHLTTLPTLSERLIVGAVPEQTEESTAAAVPPAEAGMTVTSTEAQAEL